MMVITSGSHRARRVSQSLGSCALLLGLAGAFGVIVAPASAQATPPSKAAVGHTSAGREARPLASSLCSKVSPASVAAIVGHSVPAPIANTIHQPATEKNFGVSGVLTLCSFGTETSLAALPKIVVLEIEVTSKPITMSEVEQELAKTSTASSTIKITPYSGLGDSAFYFTDTSASVTGQGMEVVAGTKSFAATVFAKNVSKSKLAALAKLAEKL
ncbi:MAG TPA: hypothetical protein VIJ86_02755 [Acidimicrobiales bacterium]